MKTKTYKHWVECPFWYVGTVKNIVLKAAFQNNLEYRIHTESAGLLSYLLLIDVQGDEKDVAEYMKEVKAQVGKYS